MSILALVASPRRNGNTEILVDTIFEGTSGRHRQPPEKLYVYDHMVGPCIDCRGCKKGDNICIVDDGMQPIYPRLEAADSIVFATPVYWCGPSGPMKTLIDRLRPYFASRKLQGKGAIIVAPAKDGPAEADLLVAMLQRSFRYLGMECLGTVLGAAYDRGEIRQDQQAMAAARDLGSLL